MDRRIIYEPAEGAEEAPAPRASQESPGPNRLRLASRARRERGPGSFRYSRGVLAELLGVRPSAIYSAERRGSLVVSDLVSVARFLVARLDRAARRAQRRERRRMRDTHRAMSVTGGT